MVNNACTWAACRENQALPGLLKSLEEGKHGQQWPVHLCSLALSVLLAAWHGHEYWHGCKGSRTLRHQHTLVKGSAVDPECCT